ncbi:MAG: ABC transporter ATP-binding protein [Defluviitaleaceae bacterium]|nr:ABC transporter ATP-binding protein [Defluviitaleaceae bacterium]
MNIQLQNLTMAFNNNPPTLKGINTTIKDGQLASLLGPSGCGKSTTLMLLAGLYKPTEGKILFGDKDVTNKEAEHRGIGMVFQNYALYPHLSVLKNIMFPLKMKKVPKAEAIERATKMAKLTQIDHLLDRKPGQLSGGQQQRVAIARALVKEPELLLLDEPLSNLDARLRLEMREEIRRIQLEVGITTIFVTHDQEEALSISDKVILMNDGEIIQEASPLDIYKTPNSIFSATFIGSPPINMIKDGDKILGIRPENLKPTAEANSKFSGTVTYRETIGRDTLIKVKCGENTLNALLETGDIVNFGDTVHLTAEKENIYNFDASTGRRV